MTTWAMKTEFDRERVIKVIRGRELPSTVAITKGAPRSTAQNRLQRKLCLEAQEQGDQTADQYRAYCKLHFGVAIMKFESAEWADAYNRIIRPMAYEQKLEMMAEPMDFPVTRCMSTKGKKKYLDQMYDYFHGLGFVLTEPELRGMEAA